MDCSQAASKKNEMRSAKSETSPNAGNRRQLETQRRFAHFHPFRSSTLFRVSTFEFWILRIARWLLALVGTMIAGLMVYVGIIVVIIWRLQAINLW